MSSARRVFPDEFLIMKERPCGTIESMCSLSIPKKITLRISLEFSLIFAKYFEHVHRTNEENREKDKWRT